jgi:hypothetical protein
MSIEKSESPARSSQEKEKVSFSEQEDVHKVPLYNPHVDVSGVDERKLLRKIDWMLIPWLSLLYLSSFLDRTAIGK